MADSFKSAQGSSKSVQRIKVTKTIQKTLPNVRHMSSTMTAMSTALPI